MVLKVGFALVFCQALQPVILDPNTVESTRLEVNRLYGSFLKALYTMFEITHSGSWPAVVRPIVEKVNAWYAVLFLTYITLVVFATRLAIGWLFSVTSSKITMFCFKTQKSNVGVGFHGVIIYGIPGTLNNQFFMDVCWNAM